MAVNNRIWVGLAVLVMIGIVLLGWFLGVSPRLVEAAENEVQRQAVLAQNEARKLELDRLEDESKKLDEYKGQLADLQSRVPWTNDLSTFLGELHQLELQSGVALTNFASVDGIPFVLDNGAAVVDPTATEGTEEGAEESTSEDAAVPEVPAADPEVAAGPTQTLSPDEFIVIELTLAVTGDQEQVLAFVQALQEGNRRFLITGLRITTESGTYTGTVDGYVYVLLDPSKTPVEETATTG